MYNYMTVKINVLEYTLAHEYCRLCREYLKLLGGKLEEGTFQSAGVVRLTAYRKFAEFHSVHSVAFTCIVNHGVCSSS